MRSSDWSSDVCSSDLPPASLDGALVIDARRDQDRRGPHPHRLHRVVDIVEGLPRLGDRERRAVLGGGGGGKQQQRSEERRVGNEGVGTGRARWYPTHYKKKQ